jgi:hypothetical protein
MYRQGDVLLIPVDPDQLPARPPRTATPGAG